MTFCPYCPLLSAEGGRILCRQCGVRVCVSEESREDQRTFLLIGLCMQQASKARAEQKSLVFLSLRPGKHIYQMGALMFSTLGPREPLQKSPAQQLLPNCKYTEHVSSTMGSIQTIFANLVLCFIDGAFVKQATPGHLLVSAAAAEFFPCVASNGVVTFHSA